MILPKKQFLNMISTGSLQIKNSPDKSVNSIIKKCLLNKQKALQQFDYNLAKDIHTSYIESKLKRRHKRLCKSQHK